jgi:hypothetical protein
VNPGVSVVSPLSVAGTTFTFGAGGSFSGQATRQEDYEFFLSFAEAIDELTRYPQRTSALYDSCVFPPGLLLESKFDLESILDRAVSPIRAGTLYSGPQVGPGSSSSPAIPANEGKNIAKAYGELKGLPDIDTTAKKLADKANQPTRDRLNTIFGKVQEKYQIQIQSLSPTAQGTFITTKQDDVAKAIVNAPKIEHDTQLIIKTVVTPIYELANTIKLPAKCLSQMLSSQITAVGKSADVSIDKVKIDDADPNGDPDIILKLYADEQASKKAAYAAADSMLETLRGCKIPPLKPVEAAQPLYDPIDLIQETINFYITTSGNITPSWKLVRVSAPLTSPFLSGQIKNTDSIIITMGRPVVQDGKVVASNPMNISQQAALLGQAINQRLVP